VVADQTGRGRAPAATRVRLRWLAIVVAVMAVLTAGWPLLNTAVANRHPLASGAKVTIGSGHASSGMVTVGRGWYVQPEQSNPAVLYILRKSAVTLYIRHVSLASRQPLLSMWTGMRQVLAVTLPGASLGAPLTIRTIHGLGAITGTVSDARLVGTATIVPGPSRKFAIAMVVLAPRHTGQALRSAAHQVVLSLKFPKPSR
jgi:hypothetical protein